MAKDAAVLLKDYGYTEVQEGLFVPARRSSERWEKVEGGWHCYGPAGAPFGGGEPWGKPYAGGLVQVPYTQTEAFANVSGLHPARNPDAFEWVWPEGRLVEIYEHAPKEGPNPWRKEDGKYIREG